MFRNPFYFIRCSGIFRFSISIFHREIFCLVKLLKMSNKNSYLVSSHTANSVNEGVTRVVYTCLNTVIYGHTVRGFQLEQSLVHFGCQASGHPVVVLWQVGKSCVSIISDGRLVGVRRRILSVQLKSGGTFVGGCRLDLDSCRFSLCSKENNVLNKVCVKIKDVLKKKVIIWWIWPEKSKLGPIIP